MATVKSTTIVCIDDDPDDIEMLHEAIRSLNSTYELLEAADGMKGLELLDSLKQAGRVPCLLVLDINMPGMDGRETFVKIRRDEALSQIPVVIFSTSSSAVDKLFFQGKNAEYITKPVQHNRLVEVARQMLSYCD